MRELIEYEYFFERQLRQADLDIFEPWTVYTGILPWRMVWESSTILTVGCVPEMENPVWSVEFLFRIRLFAENRKLLNEFETNHTFKQEPETGCPPWQAEVDNVPYKIVKFIQFEALILNFSGLRTRVDKSYLFTRPNPKSNCILSTGEYKFYVNLDFLSIYSTYFNELRLKFSEKLSPSFELIIDLKRNSATTFAQLLGILFYKKKNFIDKENVQSIADVAYLFSFETILKECELYLVNKPIRHKSHAFELLHLSTLYGFYEIEAAAKKYLDYTDHTPFLDIIVTTEQVGLPFLTTGASCKCTKLNKMYTMTVINNWVFKYKRTDDGLLSVTVSPYFLNRRCINWKIETGIKVQIGQYVIKKRLNFNAVDFKLKIELPDAPHFVDGLTVMDTYFQVFSVQGIRAFTALEDNVTFRVKDKTSTAKLSLNDGKKLYVNIQYLAHYSQWFLEQIGTLSALPKEEGLPVVEVNAMREDFLLFLRTIYPSKVDAFGQNLQRLILLAEKYQMPSVLIYCEQKFVATNTDELQFALDFGLKSAVKKVSKPLPSWSRQDAPRRILNRQTSKSLPQLNIPSEFGDDVTQKDNFITFSH